VEYRITADEYFHLPETNRPQELRFGVLREPPAPGFHHQIIVGALYSRLERHTRRRKLGQLVLSPVDVVLDMTHALVVQPDLVFISRARLGIATQRVWGAPDLVVEVLSKTNRRHDSTTKVGWYKTYGVRECWLVDPDNRMIDVLDLTPPEHTVRVFFERQRVRSLVFPHLRLRGIDVFGGP
jgi:Uma2 family endonuclease